MGDKIIGGMQEQRAKHHRVCDQRGSVVDCGGKRQRDIALVIDHSFATLRDRGGNRPQSSVPQIDFVCLEDSAQSDHRF
jgi:hypothetical protein